MNLNIPYIVYITGYIIAGSILTMMTSHIWINRKILKPGLGIAILFTSWLWYTCQLFEYIMAGYELKLLFNTFQYIGIAFLPPAWIGFCYSFAFKDQIRGYRLSALCGILSLGWLIVIFTNHFHHLMWTGATLNANNINIVKTFSPLYYVFIGYIYLLTVGGFVLILGLLKNRQPRRHTMILIVAGGFPVIANISEYLFRHSLSYLEITPISFAFSSLIVIYFIRLRYFRIIPLTQHSVIESLSDLVILLSPDNQIVYLNPAVSSLINEKETGIIGTPLSRYLPDFKEILETDPEDGMLSKEVTVSGITYFANLSPIYNWRNRLINKVLVLRDITRLKDTETSLRKMKENLEQMVDERTKELLAANKSLEEEIEVRKGIEMKLNRTVSEKTILLGEIHHRVKNNLQIIISLLKLQRKYIEDEKSLDIFNTAISRIQSIAIIHEKLYKSKDLTDTDVADYVHDLTRYLLASYSTGGNNISMRINIGTIYLDLDRSILCGLIINELLLNAIKYAFPPERTSGEHSTIENTITVKLIRENGEYLLSINDNGVGLPPDFDIATQPSLGMKIVTTLTKQLGGTISVKSDAGTTISIRFPTVSR
ncbi:MAG: hypothetical protein JW881_17405 [Spirochaetales bacterium]|nr:hypothetical protein [Spirochaetales bacterium]